MGISHRSTHVATPDEPLGSQGDAAIADDSEKKNAAAVTGDAVASRTVAARRANTVIVIAAIAVVVAAFLPWASFLRFSKSGIEGDGRVTLVLALVGLLLVWRRRLGWIAQALLAGIVAVVSLYDLSDAGSLAAVGLYLTFFAGGAWIVGAFMARAARAA